MHVFVNRFCVNQLEFVVCVCDFTSRASVVSRFVRSFSLTYSRQLWTTAQQNNRRNQKKKENRLRTVNDARMGVAVIQYYVRAITLLFVCAILRMNKYDTLSFIYSTLAPLARSDLNIVSQFVFWILQERKYKFSFIKKRNQWNFDVNRNAHLFKTFKCLETIF